MLHRGHFELLRYCKTLGNVIVGLNSDNSVTKLKGPTRPYFNEEDRKFALLSCSYVDEVRVFDQETPYDLIKQIKPDIIVKGGDYNPNTVVGADLCEVKIFSYIDGYSTTGILEKI